ncbi:hypothetical protein QAD02_006562 [Eretmocerus hayati]|uniref:Uncharacterized protein n=1 Tax=Eretmocerus hayati TaxID=131215 RepID=A0ACC2N173_9HYME|nr:hypothetical protein QAD02_006562 [Eretmocerus hayati]
MGILRTTNQSNAQRDMQFLLESFHNFNPLVRVLQWITNKTTEVKNTNSKPIEDFRVSVHSFNAFDNTFSREILSNETKLFPNKVKNLHGSPLIVKNRKGSRSFLAILLNHFNSTIHPRNNGNTSGSPGRYPERSEMIYDILEEWFFTAIHDSNPTTKWDLIYNQQLRRIYLPIYERYNFYLLRPKKYAMEISWLAVVAFGGLFSTALIFAIWAKLLRFREPNWSFLNILTAQMGSSLEIRGSLTLSKQIYQMSIYTATFFVVSWGADYTFQIFIKNQKLPEIKTMRDLSNSNIQLVMEEIYYDLHMMILSSVIESDPEVKKVFDSIQTRVPAEAHSEFCRRLIANKTIEDELINLCIAPPEFERQIVTSNSKLQIDMIQEPIVTSMMFYKLGENPFFKNQLEKFISRYSEVGLLLKWYKNTGTRRGLQEGHRTYNKEKDEEVPLQNQLWPILVAGFTLGIIVLMGEIIWKLLIEKSEFGRLTRAFYNTSNPNSSNHIAMWAHRTNRSTITVSKLKKTESESQNVSKNSCHDWRNIKTT